MAAMSAQPAPGDRLMGCALAGAGFEAAGGPLATARLRP